MMPVRGKLKYRTENTSILMKAVGSRNLSRFHQPCHGIESSVEHRRFSSCLAGGLRSMSKCPLNGREDKLAGEIFCHPILFPLFDLVWCWIARWGRWRARMIDKGTSWIGILSPGESPHWITRWSRIRWSWTWAWTWRGPSELFLACFCLNSNNIEFANSENQQQDYHCNTRDDHLREVSDGISV